MNDNSVSIPSHLESVLGPIVYGWSDAKSDHKIVVAKFADTPEAGVVTYSTLGLSDFELELSNKEKIRQELLFSTETVESETNFSGLLFSVAESAIDTNRAFHRGEIVSIPGDMLPNTRIVALYVTNPSAFPDTLISLSNAEPPVIFVFLVPITSQERNLIQAQGWGEFEKLLEEQDPNIWDLRRTDEVIA